MKKETLFSLLFFAALFVFLFSLNSRAGEVITDEKLYEMIGGKSHTVMAKQLERLQEVLEGFLAGNWQQIDNSISHIRQDIDRIGSEYVKYSDENIPALQALDEMRKESTALRTELEAKNFEKAYQHFQTMNYQCIKCHQARRSWGKFEEIKEVKEGEPEKAAAPSTVSTKVTIE